MILFRGSSPALCQAVIDGIEAAGGRCSNYGILSTPQLHFFVVCQNTNGAYGKATEEGYFEKLGKAFLLFGNGVSILAGLRNSMYIEIMKDAHLRFLYINHFIDRTLQTETTRLSLNLMEQMA